MTKKKEQPESVEFTLSEADVDRNLDPRLQSIILTAREGGLSEATSVYGEAADGTVNVDVLAKLRDTGVPVPGLTVVRVIGQIVTGSVALEQIEAVRNHPNVVSLKAATRLHPDLEFSVSEIQAARDTLAAAGPAFASTDGKGVIVGVVDYDCDFVHRNFRNADGTTRLLYLWDQQSGPTSLSPAGFGYGREFDTTAINAALAAAPPANPRRAYQDLAYVPEEGGHGTHVMDIAAGNGNATGFPGVAPAAHLVFVHIAASDYEAHESFGNSRRLLEAVEYIFTKADALGLPAVVNLSLGTHGGPHDGSTLAEQGFDALLEKPGRAIVLSAGNSRGRQSHAAGTVTAAQPRRLQWQINPGDMTGNEMEVWYSGAQQLRVTLHTPTGVALGPVAPGDPAMEIRKGGVVVGLIINRSNDPNNGDNQIDILLSPTLPSGIWQVELTTPNAQPVAFHAWIERDDRGRSMFSAQDTDTSHTIGSISCSKNTLVVGAYNAVVPARDIAPFSSEGPTRDGRLKPEVSAPGVGINAAMGTTQGLIRMSGTSMASPHVTGLTALVLQKQGAQAKIADIRAAVMSTARRTPATLTAWQAQYGEGRVDALAALQSKALVAPPAVAVTGIATPISDWVGASATGVALAQLTEVLARVASTQKTRVRIEIEVYPDGA